MKRTISLFIAVFVAAMFFSARAQILSGTYKFAQRDTCELFLDFYDATPGVSDTLEGHARPAVIFVFGGGFIAGSRSEEWYLPWFKTLNDNGYKVFTIDYRLGLKGVKGMGVSKVGLILNAVDLGVEDLCSATSFIVDNAEAFGIEPSKLVVSGSSAGAMISLQTEWYISNSSPKVTAILPAGFNYAGLMSFAGAVLSDHGYVKYPVAPCPQLLIHGTLDETVVYDQIRFLNWRLCGSSALASIFAKNGFVYNIWRFSGHTHDMAGNMLATWSMQEKFLEEAVIKGSRYIIDCTISDPSIPTWPTITLDSLYK